MNFNNFLWNLNSMGFYDFVLPWILFLIIYFVILERAPFWPTEKKGAEGKEKNVITAKGKQYAIITAAILAMFTVNYPLNGIPLGNMLSDFFGTSAIYIGGFLVILLFLGMAGYQYDDVLGNKTALAFVLLIVAMIVLGASGFPMFYLDDGTWTLLFVLALIGGAVIFLGDEK